MSRFHQHITIEDRKIGKGCPVYIIAEAGVAHFGSEEKACQLIDLAAGAGADAVKFQVFDIDAMISKELPEWRERLASRCLPYDAFVRIKKYCADKKITFFATAHEEKSLQFLATLRVPVYKVGSGEVGNWPYLQQIAKLGKPIILSTGMYRVDQIGETLDILASENKFDVALLHCVTLYPVPPQEAALGQIAYLHKKFGVISGYSDHTSGYHFPLAAVALGASIIEKHITLDYNIPNAQDWKVSCGPPDLAEFIRLAREIEIGLGDKTNGPTKNEMLSLDWAGKSLVAARPLKAGETVLAQDLASKRPGSGISPADLEKVVGQKTKVDLAADTLIKWEHLT